jgi:GNAT superfamily N-acetyltransferase
MDTGAVPFLPAAPGAGPIPSAIQQETPMPTDRDRHSLPRPTIRSAVAADAPMLAGLRFEFRAGLAPEAVIEPEFHRRCSAWMAARLPRTDVWSCWIAEMEPAGPCGTVWVQWLEKLPNPADEPERHAYVTNLYVRPAARDQGVGSALLEAVLAECVVRGCDAVFLWPTPRSRSLYLRHGFSAESGVLERRLWHGRSPA